jgi:hypothetical protein
MQQDACNGRISGRSADTAPTAAPYPNRIFEPLASARYLQIGFRIR